MNLLFIFVLVQIAQSARILGIFFEPGYSHFVLGETIFKELARRGHDVTVISAFPQKEKLPNYRDVPLDGFREILEGFRVDLLDFLDKPDALSILETSEYGRFFVELTLKHDNVKNFLNSKQTFDIIVMEQFLNEAFFGFVHHFKVPAVLVTTLSSSLWSSTLMGNPLPYSYIPNMFSDYSPNMNIWQRSYNAFLSMFQSLAYHWHELPHQEQLLKEHFPDAPPLEDLMYNASLILLNSHPTFGAAVPLQPNMIEIGGFHVQNHEPLSPDLKTFLDEAEEGVVYFSLGSNVKSKLLPQEKIRGIVNAFSKLKMKVLWKWEDDELPGKPPNVRIEKWLPQPAVLAHKNVKVFITQGGRLSIIESIYFGIPMIGIPIFAEQRYNVRECAHLGFGIYLSYHDLDEDHLYNTLKEVLENPRYSEMAKYRSNAFHDLPVSPLDSAIHWIEYVIRHKGVPHLRNAGINLKWYQHLMLDVALICIISVLVFKKALGGLCRKLYKSNKEKLKTN